MSLGRFLAHGTPRIVTGQLPKAMPVYGMTARQLMTGIPAAEQILLAHGAVAHVLSDFAVVRIEQLPIDAHSAVLAVAEVLPAAHAAEAAVRAVVGAFFVGHPEVADGTVIFAELNVAIYAKVGLATLLGKALVANNLPDREPIHLVVLRHPHEIGRAHV